MAKLKKNDFQERLERYRQIKLTVTGRKTGQTISVPVWFVIADGKLYLLRSMVPTRSGIATFSKIRRSGWTPAGRRQSFE
jgi:hypothetical protein